MADRDKDNKIRLLILSIIWLAGAVVDRIWLALDRNVPAWDQAQYLTGSLNYWHALQHPQWFSSEWWTSLWLLSSKIPPLIYITAAGFQQLFGIGLDQAISIQLLFSAILLGSVYGLGRQLFSVEVGLWAAGLCQLVPGLYRYKVEFLLDYPLAALVALSFWCLTVWESLGTEADAGEDACTTRRGWFWAAAFGLMFGLALMAKQPALLFLFVPLVWVCVGAIRRCQWGRLLQLVGGLCLSALVFGPWYRTNWLIVLTAGKRATIDSAVAKGDAPLNTLKAWTYYWEILPYQVSWLLLLVPIVGLLMYWQKGVGHRRTSPPHPLKSLGWLTLFWVGGYLLSSLNINKDDRYTLPYLPAVSVVLAYGLTCWASRWGRQVRFWTTGLAVMLLFLNLFPVGGVLGNGIVRVLSPAAQHHPYLGPVWPHRQVIDEIVQTEPYLTSTLGVLPSTREINQHNFNYYGALQHFQVYGRQVGIRTKQVAQDARSLSWFLTKTGDPGSVRREARAAIVDAVERSPDLQLHKTWNIPDGSTLKLYHRRVPPVQVELLSERGRRGEGERGSNLAASTASQMPPAKVQLEQVVVPDRVPPGVPVPVTYKWSGSWQQLQSGLVLLTWHQPGQGDPSGRPYRWLHDHGIGMGTLYPSFAHPLTPSPLTPYLAIEQTAMLPPFETPMGAYTLAATYLNRQTGQTYSIPVPPVTLNIDPKSAAVPAPELDLVTQLRTLAADLPKGLKALGPLFEDIGRINQYDPIQDYVMQAQLALTYRLQLEPQNRDWAYALALTKVLKRQVDGAIAALDRVTQLDSQNPYAYAYLAFIHLYDWHPWAAETPLKSAAALNPNLPEIKGLRGIAALMRGNLIEAWHDLQGLKLKNTKTNSPPRSV